MSELWDVRLEGVRLVGKQQISDSMFRYVHVIEAEVELGTVDGDRLVAMYDGVAQGTVTFGGDDRGRSAWLSKGLVSLRHSDVSY